ncbi:MAG: PP2C family serine/threonine-protein phosphatase [Sulfuricurvum sp.]|uniref:PP2C family protein-serine/threonine phosphatase n=1 Tax=Sulfuricurvum sp. TaxID=2025608 RepID=UPI00261A19F0|nr:PP2C family serine/threonine-protein phosphatase [uncultured Sulfuricurvum sp.]MDD2838644.1 serine/threonine-protein phosphatase [Sulfuricurvum sp.]
MGTSYSSTHPGHVRQNNEDSFYANDKRGLWIVCDGMGGHQEGNFASHLVTDIFEKMQMFGTFEERIEAIISQIYNIHLILKKKAQMAGTDAVIGTTIVLLYIEGEKGISIHAGDSRCYLLRDERLSLVTVDHAKEIKTHAGMRKVLTNALSAPGELSLEVKKFRVYKRDVYLLCTDGLYDNLTTPFIQKMLGSLSLATAIDSLMLSVLSKKADDNLTAVIVEI